MTNHLGDTAVHNAGYVAGSATVLLGMNAEQWGIVGVLVGIGFMVLTYATNLYFKCKADKRHK